ncbi:FecR family protein [Dyadobacter subterraneus]|uniref:FecR domain-containing protein n=1 Tax=Dyadobacter subterraneus TaxID=2773304 RepID=A0ABR9WAI1_9BACT|nr:FecR family protein [Dyadobacter subterraneus]MBE9462144.1 FecR domain-containing protein [Dyadobacter subterraneus]
MEENYYPFLEKYAQNRHTEEEHQAFLRWFNSISPLEARNVMDRYQLLLKNYADPVSPNAHADLIRKIEGRINKIEQEQVFDYENDQQASVVSLWWYFRRFAVAAVLVLIGIGSYYTVLRKSKQSKNIASQTLATDAAPGGNKAMLTLADGSVINLNEAGEGQIASQSGININKVTDGQLVYGKHLEDGGGIDNKAGIYNQITTPKAGQYQISLSDGTKVWLNSLSSIRFPAVFSADERKVEITGEVYFEVAKVSLNKKRVPFRVVSNNQIIEVIGTHFNVNSYRDESVVKTTLLEGSVKVSTIANGKISLEAVKLKPGEQSIVKPKQAAIAVEKVDTESAVAWQKGYFKFKDTNIEEVMRQLSRWYDLDVVYIGPLPQDQFTGYVSKKVAISSVLNILQEGGGVRFNVKDKKVEVSALE